MQKKNRACKTNGFEKKNSCMRKIYKENIQAEQKIFLAHQTKLPPPLLHFSSGASLNTKIDQTQPGSLKREKPENEAGFYWAELRMQEIVCDK